MEGGKVELKWIKNRESLLKKAHELAVLCDVGVGVFSERGKLFEHPDPPASLRRRRPCMLRMAMVRAIVTIVAVAIIAVQPAAASMEVTVAAPAPSTDELGVAARDDTDSEDHHLQMLLGVVTGGVSFLLLVVVVVIGFVRERQERRKQQQAQPPAPPIAQDLRDSSQLKIDEVHFTGSEEETCDIYLDAYVQGDLLGVLPCAHRFHAICIQKWIAVGASLTCPLCREYV